MKTLEHEARNKSLNVKQKEFVRQYVLMRDGKKAAIAAGYTETSAAVTAHKLLNDPAVARELGKAEARVAKEYKAKLDRAMQELFHCLTRRATDLVDEETGMMLPVHQMPERVNAAIDGYEEEVTYNKLGEMVVKRKVKMVSKATAIDMAMKVSGSYAPEKSIVGVAPVDFSNLYGQPDGALEEDVIEEPGDERVEQ